MFVNFLFSSKNFDGQGMAKNECSFYFKTSDQELKNLNRKVLSIDLIFQAKLGTTFGNEYNYQIT